MNRNLFHARQRPYDMLKIYLQNQFSLVYKGLLEMPASRKAQINKDNTPGFCGIFSPVEETDL